MQQLIYLSPPRLLHIGRDGPVPPYVEVIQNSDTTRDLHIGRDAAVPPYVEVI